jgi:hypothetical protein
VRSVLVLRLLEPRRRGISDVRVFSEAGVDEPEEGRYTKDDSMLYAGVDGSKGRSVTMGNDTAAW